MADLDEMSMVLGEIRSDIKHVLLWQKDHEIADQDRFEQLATRIEKNNGHAARIDALEVRAAEVKVVADNLQKAGWVGRGVIIGLSIVGGFLGSAFLQVSKWF